MILTVVKEGAGTWVIWRMALKPVQRCKALKVGAAFSPL